MQYTHEEDAQKEPEKGSDAPWKETLACFLNALASNTPSLMTMTYPGIAEEYTSGGAVQVQAGYGERQVRRQNWYYDVFDGCLITENLLECTLKEPDYFLACLDSPETWTPFYILDLGNLPDYQEDQSNNCVNPLNWFESCSDVVDETWICPGGGCAPPKE